MSHKQPASEDFVDVFFGDQALPHLPSNPHGSHGNFYDDWKDEGMSARRVVVMLLIHSSSVGQGLLSHPYCVGIIELHI